MIAVTGDLHGSIDIERLGKRKMGDLEKRLAGGTLLIAGDFGLVWDGSRSDSYWLDWLADKKYDIAFVDGNHENFRLLATFPETEWNGGRARRIRPNVFHLLRGESYVIEGRRLWTFGGAESHDKEWRKEGVSWWPEELPSEDEYARGLKTLDRIGWKADLVLTHTAPQSLIDARDDLLPEVRAANRLSRYLDDVSKHLSFGHWFIGHYHRDADLPSGHGFVYRRVVEA